MGVIAEIMEANERSRKQDGLPPIIHLHGAGPVPHPPGDRVSVIDVMMWKMYGTKSPYIIEAPKPTLREWTLIKPASQRMKENQGLKIFW